MSINPEMSDDELWEISLADDVADRADAQNELAHRKLRAGEFEFAKNLYGSACDLYVQLEKTHEVGMTTYGLGYCQYRLLEYDEAIVSLERALASGEETNDSKVIGFCAGPLADCYTAKDREADAIPVYELAIETFIEAGEEAQAAYNSLSLGEIFGQKARQTDALSAFIRAFNLFQAAGDAFGAAKAKDRMAAALIELEDYDQALSHLDDALNTFEFLEASERVSHTQYRIGWTLVLAGKYYKAEKPLREAIKDFKQNQDFTRAALAQYHLAVALSRRESNDDEAESEKLIDQVRAYFEAAGERENVLMVDAFTAAKLMRIGFHSEAADIYKDIIKRAEEYGDRYSARATRSLLAEALALDGDHQEAREVLGQINPEEWGENKSELARIEKVRALLDDEDEFYVSCVRRKAPKEGDVSVQEEAQ